MDIKVRAIHPEGFDVTLTFDDIERVGAVIEWLVARGYSPTAAGAEAWPRTPSGEPLCRKHKVVMPLRNRQGDTWHSHRIIDASGQELWCRGYKSGQPNDGWDV